MSLGIARNEGQTRLAAAARARTQQRLAKTLGCSQGFLSKVLSGQQAPSDALKTKAATELGIELGAWGRACAAAPEHAEDERPPPAPPAADPGAPVDRPGLALERTLLQLEEVRTKLAATHDPVEWARLARIETAAVRTLAELRGEIGHGREMRLRAELDAARRETELIVATVKEALKPFPEAARAAGEALQRAFPTGDE